MDESAIFWAEGDDDAARITGAAHLSRLAYVAYLLMGKQVVIHPAYIWQNEDTHHLVFPSGIEATRPNNTSLILGGSSNASEYIRERIDKLERQTRSGETVVELEQYRKHAGVIFSEADALDNRFVAETAVHQLGWSRDEKFRELVRHDLENSFPFGQHLYSCVVTGTSVAHRETCIKRLIGLTRDNRRLVSVDSVIRIAVRNGFQRALRSQLEKRLHVLHWLAHEGEGLRVPLLARIDNRIDCDDPNVFWGIMEKMFGGALKAAVISEPWGQVLQVIERIRGDILWHEFIAAYHDIVDIIRNDDGEICDQKLFIDLAKRYPNLFKGSLPKLSRFGWLSVVCTLLTLQIGMPILAVGGAVGTIGDAIQNSVRAYHRELCVGRSALRARIMFLLEAQSGVGG